MLDSRNAVICDQSTCKNGIAHLCKCFRGTAMCDKSILRSQKQVDVESQRKHNFFYSCTTSVM